MSLSFFAALGAVIAKAFFRHSDPWLVVAVIALASVTLTELAATYWRALKAGTGSFDLVGCSAQNSRFSNSWSASGENLRDWLASMLLVLFFFNLSFCLSWFALLTPEGQLVNSANWMGKISESFLFFPILFLPIASWHFFALFEDDDTHIGILRHLGSYRLFALNILAIGSSMLLISSRYFHNECPSYAASDIQYGFTLTCSEQPTAWLLLLFWCSLWSLVALACIKGVCVLASRHQRLRK